MILNRNLTQSAEFGAGELINFYVQQTTGKVFVAGAGVDG